MAGYYDRDRNTRTAYGHNANAKSTAGTMNHPMTHHGNTAEYMGSGFPWVYQKGSAYADERIEFPFVTQWVCITSASACHIAFKASQSDEVGDAMRFMIPANTLMPLRIKCVDMWVDSGVATDVTIMAGLTNVPRSEFPTITGLEGVDHVYHGTGTGASSKVTPA